MLEATAGEVFADPIGELTRVREGLAWYPRDIWLLVMAGHWRRISQLEHFPGRTGSRGDELGSRLIAASLVQGRSHWRCEVAAPQAERALESPGGRIAEELGWGDDLRREYLALAGVLGCRLVTLGRASQARCRHAGLRHVARRAVIRTRHRSRG